MKPTREQVIKLRTFWRPRHPECDKPCPGCPFEQGNDAAFGRVVKILRDALGLTGRVTVRILRRARLLARADIQRSGDFVCHHTAYDLASGKPRDASEHRQCAGAAKLYRAGEV